MFKGVASVQLKIEAYYLIWTLFTNIGTHLMATFMRN